MKNQGSNDAASILALPIWLALSIGLYNWVGIEEVFEFLWHYGTVCWRYYETSLVLGGVIYVIGLYKNRELRRMSLQFGLLIPATMFYVLPMVSLVLGLIAFGPLLIALLFVVTFGAIYGAPFM